MTRAENDRSRQENQIELQHWSPEGHWRGERKIQKRRAAKDSRTSPRAPSWKPLSRPEGQHHVCRVMMKLACIRPMGKRWGKQQHLVLVPEDSSDRVAWRTLAGGVEALMLDPGPKNE